MTHSFPTRRSSDLERQGRREHEERADAKHAGPMVERPVDILNHIGCLKNRAKQSAHHFLRRCIRSSEEGPCLKVTPFKTVMTVLNEIGRASCRARLCKYVSI